eukprot:5219519-Pleurochrysis_carterae.AAC.2
MISSKAFDSVVALGDDARAYAMDGVSALVRESVSAWVRGCVGARVRECACVCACVSVRACVRACVRALWRCGGVEVVLFERSARSNEGSWPWVWVSEVVFNYACLSCRLALRTEACLFGARSGDLPVGPCMRTRPCASRCKRVHSRHWQPVFLTCPAHFSSRPSSVSIVPHILAMLTSHG